MQLTYQALIVLLVLLPGFLTARILGSLCVRKAQSELDKIVEALIWSFIIYVSYSFLFPRFPIEVINAAAPEPAGYLLQVERGKLVVLPVLAAALGIIWAAILNKDLPGRLLRRFGITQRTSSGSVWLDVFGRLAGYVLLELADGRLVFGWLHYYPDSPEEGDMFLEDAAWVLEDGKRIAVIGPGILITKAMGIKSVAFLDPKESKVHHTPD